MANYRSVKYDQTLAKSLVTSRTIGGVAFDGTANINLPGVNTSGNQDTTGNAATATALATARTIHGVSFDGTGNIDLSEVIQDTVGAMFSSNTETGVTVTYQDGDGTIDVVVGTLNQDTTGNAATATALETARTIGGVSFDGTGNINLPGVNTSGNQNTSGTAAVATTVTITDNESTNENNAIIFAAGGDQDGGNLGLESDGTLTYNPSTGKITATGFVGALTGDVTGDVTGNADTATALATARTIHGVSFDGTGNIDLTEVVQDTVGAMFSSNTETGITVTYQDGDGTIDLVIGTLNQDTTGNAATATALETARTIHGVSFDGTGNIDLTEVVQDTVGAMFSSNTETGITVTYQDGDGTIDLVVGTLNQDTTGNAATATALETARTIGGVSFDGTGNINLPGVNTGGNQDTSGTAAKVTVTDSNANTNFPVVFHDESNALLDDTGQLRYNPSTGTLLAPNLVVAGTTTQVNTVTMNAENAVVFEGATANDFETTLTITDPTADRTITMPDATGTMALTSSDITGNAATATALETARTIHGVSFDGTGNIDLTEVIEDTVGAMVSSNTETGLAVTYQDADGTIDFAIDAAQTAITSIFNTSLAIGYGASHANINFGTDNRIVFDIDGTSQVLLLDGVFRPTTDSDVDLGSSAKYWKDAYIDTITTTGNVTVGGVFLAPDGSVSAPSYSFSSDTNNGLSYINADNWGISAGGSFNLYIQASQTFANKALLGLDSAGPAFLNETATATNPTLAPNRADLDTGVGWASADKLTLVTGGTERVRVDSDGVTSSAGLIIADGGTIGAASDTDAITIASNGVVTFSQVPLLPNNTVATADIQADAVTGAKIADDAIDSEHYTDGSIDTAHIADDQITEAKMADDAIGSTQLKSLSTLLIKNSSGSTLKTIHGAGA